MDRKKLIRYMHKIRILGRSKSNVEETQAIEEVIQMLKHGVSINTWDRLWNWLVDQEKYGEVLSKMCELEKEKV